MVRSILMLASTLLAVSTTAQSPTPQPTAGPPSAGGGAIEPTQAPVASANSETLAPTTRNVTDTASPAPSASEAPFGAPTDRCIGGDGTVRGMEGCPGNNEPSGGMRRSTVALWSTFGAAAATGMLQVFSFV